VLYQTISSGARAGRVAALSGNTLVTNAGSGALVYELNESGWFQYVTSLFGSDSVSGDDFGYAVATAGDTIVVGAPHG